MSDAKVRFHSLIGEHVRHAGRDDDRADSVVAGQEQTFSFNCPLADRRCGDLVIAGKTTLKHDPQGANDGIAQWGWNGNREAPTFTPSINCGNCWHGYIENGRCVSVQKQDEPEMARSRT